MNAAEALSVADAWAPLAFPLLPPALSSKYLHQYLPKTSLATYSPSTRLHLTCFVYVRPFLSTRVACAAAIYRHSGVRMAASRSQPPLKPEGRKDTAARAVSIPLVEPKVSESKPDLALYLDVRYYRYHTHSRYRRKNMYDLRLTNKSKNKNKELTTTSSEGG